MTRTLHIPLLLALLAAVLLVPATAHAQGGAQVREDCLEDGKLDRRYSAAALRAALSEAPSNEDEYGGDCREIIRTELNRQLRGARDAPAGAGARPGGIGGVEGDLSADGIPDTDEDFEALQSAIGGDPGDGGDSGGDMAATPPSLSIGDQTIVPKAPAAALASTSNELPAPVWLALAALAALTVTAGLIVAQRRLPQVRRATLGLLRR